MGFLVLVRHGNTFESDQEAVYVGARSDLPLTGQGREQARIVGVFLRTLNFKPSLICCGKLIRQKETAQIISDVLEISAHPQEEPSLVELDYGKWEGLSPREVEKKWPLELADWKASGKWPDGIFSQSEESFRGAHRKWLEEQFLDHDSSKVAVTSNAVLSSIYSLLGGKNFAEESKVATGKVCIVKFSKQCAEIKLWNHAPSESLESNLFS